MAKSKQKISAIISLAGVALVVYGLILCLNSNLNLGVILVVGLGAFVLCTGIFYKKIKELCHLEFFKAFIALIIVLLCIELVLVSFIAIYGVCDNVNFTEDAVIVLGAGIRGDQVTLPLKKRLDKAIDYHSKNPNALIVVTGGQGFQETVTEAFAMEKYLIKNGVDKNIILKEEMATSTAENMRFSKGILDKKFESDYSTVIVTNNFHIYRGTTIAKQAGFKNVTHLHAGLQWYNLMPCYLRESLAVLKMLIIG